MPVWHVWLCVPSQRSHLPQAGMCARRACAPGGHVYTLLNAARATGHGSTTRLQTLAGALDFLRTKARLPLAQPQHAHRTDPSVAEIFQAVMFICLHCHTTTTFPKYKFL
eukprot:365126-Chlamydomonas_euryale.AAC.18